MPLVQGTEVDSAGQPHRGVPVRIRLVASTTGHAAGYDLAGDVAVHGEWRTRTDGLGKWSADLKPNAAITPAGTVYTVDVVPSGQPAIRHTIAVPDGPGPHRVENILAPAPTALPIPELTAHTLQTTEAHGGLVVTTDPRLTDARSPTGPAGGVLSGAFPNPGFAVDMATQVELAELALEKARVVGENVLDHGAVGNGVADDSAAFYAAIAALPPTGGVVLIPPLSYWVPPGIEWDDKPVWLLGFAGGLQPGAGTRILVAAGFTGINPRNGPAGMGANSRVENLHLIGADAAPGTNDGLRLQAQGAMAVNVTAEKFGRHGIGIISGDRPGSPAVETNANLCYSERCTTWHNYGDGFATAGGDSNGCTIVSLNSFANAGWNIHENGGLGNTYIAPHASAEDAPWMGLGDYLFGAVSRAARVVGGYSETVAGRVGVRIDAASAGNHKLDFATMDNIVEDLTATKSSSISWSAGGLHYTRLAVGDASGADVVMRAAPAGEPALQLFRGRRVQFQNAAETANWFWGVLADNRMLFGSPQGADLYVENPISVFGHVESTTGFRVGGTPVVGARGAAVADPAGGTVVDVEARAALNTLLARLRAHGLIAP